MTPEELPVKEGIMGLLGLGGVGAIWQAIRIFRRGWREDGASETTAGTYKAILKEREEQVEWLRAQIGLLETRLSAAESRSTALEDRMKTMSQRITDEINERYKAEGHARKMESERNAYKAELDDLRAVGKDWERGT